MAKLVEQGVLSDVVATSKLEAAHTLSESIDYEKYYKGATYVGLESSMTMQSEMSNRKVIGILQRENTPDVRVTYNKYWSSEFQILSYSMILDYYLSSVLIIN